MPTAAADFIRNVLVHAGWSEVETPPLESVTDGTIVAGFKRDGYAVDVSHSGAVIVYRDQIAPISGPDMVRGNERQWLDAIESVVSRFCGDSILVRIDYLQRIEHLRDAMGDLFGPRAKQWHRLIRSIRHEIRESWPIDDDDWRIEGLRTDVMRTLVTRGITVSAFEQEATTSA